MPTTIHLHKNRLNQDINIFWLLIPSVVFVSILLVFLYFFKPQNNDQTTLGAQDTYDTNLDNYY